MTNSEMTEDKRGTKEKLAIASLVLAYIALFGVYPLAAIGSNIYCMIVFGDSIVFGDCTYYDGSKFFDYSCFPSAAANVLAIILGLISLLGAHKNARTWLFALSGIVLGLVYWPLAIVTGFMLAWYTL
jgi:hypothetical protein